MCMLKKCRFLCPLRRNTVWLPGIFFFFNKFIYFIYLLFLAVLGLHCCTGATLKCGVWASHCGGFSCCEAWALGARAQ